MMRILPVGRAVLLALAATVAALALTASARADSSCADDLKKLTDRRVVVLNDINGMAAESKKTKKPLAPDVFCGKARVLNAAEDALLAYMVKNKDWCGVPDEVIASLKASHAKSVEFGGRACVAAANMKKAQEQQAAGAAPQAPPLPAGPL